MRPNRVPCYFPSGAHSKLRAFPAHGIGVKLGMGLFGRTAKPSAASLERCRAWEIALDRNGLPDFVTERLAGAAAGKGAWVATMTPAELLLSRTHGIRPVATVSGTCWFSYGWSWTEGHAQGWHDALDRIRREAVAAGANAVVDVKMRTLRHSIASSMDFTLIGTAVKIDRLKPSPSPVISTVSALEFVRLLEADIVPTGIAVGARYDWLGAWVGGGYSGSYGGGWGDSQALWNTQQARSLFAGNVPLRDLMHFWEMIRRDAHADLRDKVREMGNGVLAHTHFGQLIERERDKQPPAFLGRHIVIGTVVDAKYGAPVPHDIEMVVDMRDDLSPLRTPDAPRHSSYESDVQDQEGDI